MLLRKAIVLRHVPRGYSGRKKKLAKLAFQTEILRSARKRMRVANDRVQKALDCKLGLLQNQLAPDRCLTHVIYSQKLIPPETYCRCSYREEIQRDLCQDIEICLGYSCEHCSADRWRMRSRRTRNHPYHQSNRVEGGCSQPDSDFIDSPFEDSGNATKP